MLFLHFYNRMNLVRVNATKVVIVLVYTIGAFLTFVFNDLVNLENFNFNHNQTFWDFVEVLFGATNAARHAIYSDAINMLRVSADSYFAAGDRHHLRFLRSHV